MSGSGSWRKLAPGPGWMYLPLARIPGQIGQMNNSSVCWMRSQIYTLLPRWNRRIRCRRLLSVHLILPGEKQEQWFLKRLLLLLRHQRRRWARHTRRQITYVCHHRFMVKQKAISPEWVLSQPAPLTKASKPPATAETTMGTRPLHL